MACSDSVRDRHCALEFPELCSSRTVSPDPASAYATRAPPISMVGMADPGPGPGVTADQALDLAAIHADVPEHVVVQRVQVPSRCPGVVPGAYCPQQAPRPIGDGGRGSTCDRAASTGPHVV
jgi:hypothetical protein